MAERLAGLTGDGRSHWMAAKQSTSLWYPKWSVVLWYFEKECIMAAATAPIKVDTVTDDLITQAAHFMQRPKKEIVDLAVREYVERHRAEIHEGVVSALRSLDGSTQSAVSLLTGMNAEELEALGGFDK